MSDPNVWGVTPNQPTPRKERFCTPLPPTDPPPGDGGRPTPLPGLVAASEASNSNKPRTAEGGNGPAM